jgi:hypothetical protein
LKVDAATRMGVIASLWSQLRAGTLPADFVLKTLPAFDGEANRYVTGQVLDALYGMSDAIVDDAARPGFRAYVLARLQAHKKTLGWKARPKEDDEVELFRHDVLYALGELAEDPQTLAEAEPIAAAWLKDPTSVDPDIGPLAVELASHRAGADRWEALRAFARDTKTPQDRITALHALAAFDDPVLVTKTLDLMLTDETRMQDMRYLFGRAVERRVARKTVVTWALAHWDALKKKLPGSLAGRVVRVAGAVCTKEEKDEVEAFFTPRVKEVEGAERPLAEGLEAATLCTELRAQAAPVVTKYFAKR